MNVLLGPVPCYDCRVPIVVMCDYRTVTAGTDQLHDCKRIRRGGVRWEDIRSAPCACGGLIVAYVGSETSIVAAVRSHQETAQHRAWWQRGGLEQRQVAA